MQQVALCLRDDARSGARQRETGRRPVRREEAESLRGRRTSAARPLLRIPAGQVHCVAGRPCMTAEAPDQPPEDPAYVAHRGRPADRGRPQSLLAAVRTADRCRRRHRRAHGRRVAAEPELPHGTPRRLPRRGRAPGQQPHHRARPPTSASPSGGAWRSGPARIPTVPTGATGSRRPRSMRPRTSRCTRRRARCPWWTSSGCVRRVRRPGTSRRSRTAGRRRAVPPRSTPATRPRRRASGDEAARRASRRGLTAGPHGAGRQRRVALHAERDPSAHPPHIFPACQKPPRCSTRARSIAPCVAWPTRSSSSTAAPMTW